MAKLKMLLKSGTKSISFMLLTANGTINIVDTDSSYKASLSGNTVNIASFLPN